MMRPRQPAVASDVTPLLAEVEASRAKLAAIREAAEAVQCDATRKVLRILDGPTP